MRLAAQILARLNHGRHSYLRSIGILVSGSVMGHAITAAAMPIATRLYDPADFTSAATFSSLTAILISVACLRLEMAISLASTRSEAVHLLLLSLASAVVMSFVAGLAILIAGSEMFIAIGLGALAPFAALVPLALLVGGAFLALQMWYVREQRFSRLASVRVGQSAVAASGQVGLGLLGAGPIGLISAQSINYGAAATFLLPTVLRDELSRERPRFDAVRATLLKYSAYPRYSVIESLANTASIHVPVLIIAATATGAEAGYVALAMFVLQIPMALIGNAVAQVYLSEARQANEEGRLDALTKTTVISIAKIAAGPFILLGFIAPLAFTAVFGPEWGRSGVLVSSMAPWFFMQLLASPVSGALHICWRQRLAMWLQVFGMVLRIGMVTAAAMYQPALISEFYALSGMMFYILYIYTVINSVRKNECVAR